MNVLIQGDWFNHWTSCLYDWMKKSEWKTLDKKSSIFNNGMISIGVCIALLCPAPIQNQLRNEVPILEYRTSGIVIFLHVVFFLFELMKHCLKWLHMLFWSIILSWSVCQQALKLRNVAVFFAIGKAFWK